MLQDSYSGRGILTWGLAPVSYSNSVSQTPSTRYLCGYLIFYCFVRGLCKSRCFVNGLLYLLLMVFFLYNQTPVKDLYHQLNSTLATVHLASNSSFFCPLTLRGGLSRRPSSPTAFPLLTYDVSFSVFVYYCIIIIRLFERCLIASHCLILTF